MKGRVNEVLERLRAPSDLLFLVAFSIFIASRIVDTSMLGFHGGAMYRMTHVALILLAISEIPLVVDDFRHLPELLLVLVVLVVLKMTGYGSYAWIVAFVYCAKRMPFSRIARVGLVVTVVVVTAIVVASQCGLVEDYLFGFGDRFGRHGLGFKYTATTGHYLLLATMLWIYLAGERFNFFQAACAVFLGGVVFWLTDSRVSLALTIVLVCGALVLRYHGTRWQTAGLWLEKLFAVSPLVIFLIFLILTMASGMGGPLTSSLDALLTGRLRYGFQAFQSHSVSLVPRFILFVGQALDNNGVLTNTIATYDYVDCSYLKLLIQLGIPLFLLLLYSLTGVCSLALRKGEHYLLLALAVFSVLCAVDDVLMAVEYNTFLLLIGTWLYELAKPSKVLGKIATGDDETASVA